MCESSQNYYRLLKTIKQIFEVVDRYSCESQAERVIFRVWEIAEETLRNEKQNKKKPPMEGSQ